jgi:hypothetical protein
LLVWLCGFPTAAGGHFRKNVARCPDMTFARKQAALAVLAFGRGAVNPLVKQVIPISTLICDLRDMPLLS